MKPAYTYQIRPKLPEKLQFLSTLAYNMWWSWNHDALDLYRRIDRTLWGECGQNPVLLLGRVKQEKLEALARDPGFVSHMARVRESLEMYMAGQHWYQRSFPQHNNLSVAYFSAEYALNACLPVYSGGLGVLSGDHLKTASDMGLPLVAVGLAYRQGYFHQYLNIDGWQQERYEENDFYNLPLRLARGADGQPLRIEVPYASLGGGGSVFARIWRVDVGRVPLLLLATNLQDNKPEDREITAQLYGGDTEMRIRQEIVLGIGGVIALQALGFRPNVFHMNEGHSAFLPLERIARLMEDGLDYPSAFEAATTGNCFTTHTPVQAGNDVFDDALVKKYLGPLAQRLGLGWEQFAALGRDHDVKNPRNYCMTVAALRLAGFANGVSRLHASVSRGMWQPLWPDLPKNEVPIRPVTNAIHLPSWVSHDMAELFETYVGPDWREDPLSSELWNRVLEIPDEELWRVHERRRARLIALGRRWMEKQLTARGAAGAEVAVANEMLDPEALTIGFGRRFATYKRATLLFRDLDRLIALVGDKSRPVQFIFSGKAHPKDDEGKQFIREIVHAVRDPALRLRFVFIEDYNMHIARYMVQGVDVWLNTPRRPLEASGTSGMKAVANGALHLSTLDGWWDQGYDPSWGWAIGAGEEYDDPERQDQVEGEALYEILEREVLPLFWQRGQAGVPREWIAMMKRSLANLLPRFCSNRMLRNYIEEAYIPAMERTHELAADDFAEAKQLGGWRRLIAERFGQVKILSVEADRSSDLLVGDSVKVRAVVDAAGLAGGDLRAEIYCGTVDNNGNFLDAIGTEMHVIEEGDGKLVYGGSLIAPQSGHFGLTVRVFPVHPGLPSKYALSRVAWASV